VCQELGRPQSRADPLDSSERRNTQGLEVLVESRTSAQVPDPTVPLGLARLGSTTSAL